MPTSLTTLIFDGVFTGSLNLSSRLETLVVRQNSNFSINGNKLNYQILEKNYSTKEFPLVEDIIVTNRYGLYLKSFPLKDHQLSLKKFKYM